MELQLQQTTVFTEQILLFGSDEITTDFGRTEARLSSPFTIPLDPGQKIAQTLMFLEVQRIGGFSPGRVQVILNRTKIFDQEWPLGFTGTVGFDKAIDPDLFFTDGTQNILEVRFFQGPFDGLNRWIVFAQLIYNGNTFQEPSMPPEVGEVIPDEDPTEGAGDGDGGIFGFDVVDFLFGDVNKTVRTIAIVGGVVAAAVIIPPVARAITATQKVRRRTAI